MPNTDETTSGDPRSSEATDGVLSRRVVVRGATLGGLALPLLAACGGGEESAGSSSDPSTSAGADASSPEATGSSGAAAAGMTVAASDVPVGGGAIFPHDKLVVTQPSKGEFKAFSAVCTHKGCPVSEVTDAQIICTCHGSHFSITDGKPVEGPATEPLGAKKVAVKGGQITVT